MARMEHFAIFAADVEALKDFYVEAMGLHVVLHNGKGKAYFLADDAGMAVEIIPRPSGVEAVDMRYLCHIAFTVDDVDAERRRLEGLGRTFETDTVVDTPSMKTAFFRDPDGNRCQILWRARPLGG